MVSLDLIPAVAMIVLIVIPAVGGAAANIHAVHIHCRWVSGLIYYQTYWIRTDTQQELHKEIWLR